MTVKRDLFKVTIHKGHLFSLIKWVLPAFDQHFIGYQKLLQNKKIVNYFKRYYPYQRFVQIEKFVRQSKYYNKSFIDKVHLQIGLSRKIFIENIAKAQSIMSNDHIVSVSQSEHEYAVDKVLKTIFDNCSTTYRPTFHEVISAMNLKASSGLPLPWVSKRQSMSIIYDIYQRVIREEFCIITEFNRISDQQHTPLTAAFVRNQITNSGLKVRLVFAVSIIFVVVETYFNLVLKYVISSVDSTAIHGYRQVEISHLVSTTNNSHKLCIDYSSFDQRVPSFVILVAAKICAEVMRLTPYERVLFFNVVYFFIRLPVFHPEVPYVPKKCGIPSGSGFTSLFGSICNTYMLHIIIRRYSLSNHNYGFEEKYKVIVSSDDTIICSSMYIRFEKLRGLMSSVFGADIGLEKYSPPGVTDVFFLGSLWVNNEPTRNIDRMLARILFGSGNFPEMSDLELIQSRSYEILGNTNQYADVYSTFKIPYPSRVFRFVELADYSTQQLLYSKMKRYEKRGMWDNIQLDLQSSNLVWKTR